MSYLIISKDNCPYCVKAKRLFKQLDIPFTELHVPDDITREEFRVMFDGHPLTVPKIYENSTLVGGYDDFVKFMNEKGKR